MARKPTKTKPPEAGGQMKFTMDDGQAEGLRAAIRADDQKEPPDGAAVIAFWKGMAAELGFAPGSMRIDGDPFVDPITFTAEPPAPAADASIEGRGDEGRREAEQTTAVERLESLGQLAEVHIDFLLGDVREFFLDLFKTRPRVWSQCNEAEQRDIVAACDHAARDFIGRAVEMIRADGRDSIRALLESYSEKDGIKAIVKIKPIDEADALAAVIGLHKAQGKHVLLTVASADDYTGQRRESVTEPDQPGMTFEGPAGDTDLSDAAENTEPRFGVYNDDGDWLNSDDAWVDDIAEAGRWLHGQASDKAAEFGGTVKEFVHAEEPSAEEEGETED